MRPEKRTNFLTIGIGLSVVAGIYLLHAFVFNFTQDDAFISYRYVQNFLAGQGLVFNMGERVEGYTNFFWVVLLTLFGRWGFDIITVSKVLGICSGFALLPVLYVFSRRLWPDQPPYTHLAVPLWLASSAVFAYWSISGLEEVFYVLCLMGGVFCFVLGRSLHLPFFILAAIVRPEGVLFFALAEAGGLLFLKRGWSPLLHESAIFALATTPLFGFRMGYYGLPFPNTFYAKVDLSWAYLKSGGAYFWLFLKQYGFYGLMPALVAAGYRSMAPEERFVFFVAAAYSGYVLAIGGDWLQGHRFLLPIFPFLLLLFQRALWRFLRATAGRFSARGVLFAAAGLGCAALLAALPWRGMKTVHLYSKALVDGMSTLAKAFAQTTPEKTSIALSDIGAFAYYLNNRTVLDLWGLTDTYITCHPKPVPGIESGWKERTYNIDYILRRRPDYILFSTNLKPVTPAEQALFLHSGFRRAYSVWQMSVDHKWFYDVYRRTGPAPEEGQLWANPAFLAPLQQGLSLPPGQRGALLRKALDLGPRDFAILWNEIAFDDWYAGRIDQALTNNRMALELDSLLGAGYLLRARIFHGQGRRAERDSVLLRLWQISPECMRMAGLSRPKE